MKAIVFGGSGFVGSHVADVLTEAGHEVLMYDLNKSKYLQPSQEIIVGDILDEDKVRKAVKGCDVVYNFAGIADIEESKQRAFDTIKYNILGNSIILEACCKIGVKKFIYASSLYVYSKAGSFYRSTKQACELLIENYHEVFGLPFTILRYGSLYGPRSDGRNWIYSKLRQATLTNKITREGDGEEIREYIHVFDAARLSVDVLKPEYNNEYVIISGHQQIKIKDMLIMIKEMLGNKVEIEYLQARDPEHYEITPYAFSPKLAKRIMCNNYVDIGQGMLEMIKEIFKSEKNHSLCNIFNHHS